MEYTYKQLDDYSTKLAIHLQTEYEVTKDDRIGMMLDHSLWSMVSILGILKSGGAYVPIEKSYPNDRKLYMIADTEMKGLIISSEDLNEVVELELDLPLFAIDVQLELSLIHI